MNFIHRLECQEVALILKTFGYLCPYSFQFCFNCGIFSFILSSIFNAKPVFTISSIMMNIDNSIQSGIFCISYYLGNTIHPGFLYFITGGVSNMSHPCNRNTYGSNTRSSQFIK